MRLFTHSFAYKKVLQDLILTESPKDAETFGKPRAQCYHIDAGSYLIIPACHLQLDPRLWKDPDQFDPERFLVVDKKALGKVRVDMKHWYPFGGGTTVCKGRYFAEREVLIFVAGILTMWDFEPVGCKWVIPGEINGTGTASPTSTIRVQMRRRV